MALRAMDLFKIVILIQLFYAFAITILVSTMPSESLNYVTSFSDITNEINLESVSSDVQSSLTSQTEIPVIDVGSLIFFSGNILLDLLLNFAFAIPQMMGLLISGLLLLINVDSTIYITVELFTGVIIIVMYFIAIIQLIAGLRTGRVV